VNDLFVDLMTKRLTRWIDFAEEKLCGSSTTVFVTGGNDDVPEVEELLKKGEQSGKHVVYAEDKVVNLDENHEMISTGYTNITPWNCPRDIPEEELEKRIEAIASRVQKMSNCVFNFHCPPHSSDLDTCPELDTTVSPPIPKSDGASVRMCSAGCRSVRNAIEKYQPLLGLHGHIHESRGQVRIGRTLCINPGSEYGEGILRGALIALDQNGVRNCQLTSG
jgi:Icc-related predicted phosphoesterase